MSKFIAFSAEGILPRAGRGWPSFTSIRAIHSMESMKTSFRRGYCVIHCFLAEKNSLARAEACLLSRPFDPLHSQKTGVAWNHACCRSV